MPKNASDLIREAAASLANNDPSNSAPALLSIADELDRRREVDARDAVGKALGLGPKPSWADVHRRLTDKPATCSEVADQVARAMGVGVHDAIQVVSMDYTGDHRGSRALVSIVGWRRG